MDSASYIDDNILLGTKVSDLLKNENRPHVSFSNNTEIKNSLLNEKEQLNIIKKTTRENKTILDEKLGDILEKTTHTVANFWEDYKVKMLESKYELENNKEITEEEKNKYSHILHIHTKGLFNYLRDNDNVIYLGIFLIFISVVIYIFNIIR
tara:strand:- start:53 stop:508 length:456 start_codon:yes stop_codon:yes gene_type:complete